MSILPDALPGIDVPSGLTRLAGNAKLYVKLLRQLAEEAPATREKLSAAVMQGDAAKVRAMAHSLKGAAGNLSAIAVAEAATLLETSGRSEDFPGMFLHLDLLEKALQKYVEVVGGLEAPQ